MRIIGGIEIKEGDELEILGRTYVLTIQDDLAGEFTVWADKNSFMRIYATPNFDNIKGVPIQINYDCYDIAVDSYEGKINGYDHYKQIVKDKVEKLLTSLPKCKCVLDTEIGMCVPIDVKGQNFYICTRCHGTIGRDENGRKDILTNVRVIEELNEILGEYFDEKSQELNLKSGDISPDQSFVLDNAIEKIADVVIQWATQNKEEEKEK